MTDMDLMAPQWRHKEKGGLYDVELTARGAGDLNGERVVFYSKACGEYEMFARKYSEWHDKMEPVYED